jgi:Leucine-rich repeat (LRR) protein
MSSAEQNHDPATAQQPEPKLRWFQFRLRSLFVLTFLVAIACSWLAVTIQNQREQKLAVEAIRKEGGMVESEPTWLGRLLRDDSLVAIVTVSLSDTPTTDAGLMHLRGLSQLKMLLLCDTKITDAGLVHLQGLSQLQSLFLDNTKITDIGLVHLQVLNGLRWLDLSGNQVTDAGLVHLEGLGQLQELTLKNTKVTDQGVKKLQPALPNCQIVFR